MTDDRPTPSEDHPTLSAAEVEALTKVLEMNAERAPQRFADLAATWGLGGLHAELAELCAGLPQADRPDVAVALATALQGYLDRFGPTGVVGTAETYRDHA